jgi:hypothetical protein
MPGHPGTEGAIAVVAPSIVAPLTARDAVAAAVVMALGFGLAAAAIVGRSGVSHSIGFLFGDAGLNLLVAQTVLSGGTLYRDLFSAYGPIPAYAHAAVAWMFGNTPLTYLFFLATASSLSVGLAYLLIRRAAGLPVALSVTAMGVLPVGLVPGSLVGGQIHAAYVPIERAMLLIVALAWTAPAERSIRRSILIGCLLGTWQGIRFGSVTVAVGAILMVDALSLGFRDLRGARLRGWARSLVAIGAGFCAVELAWAIGMFSTLPSDLALDVLWPRFMLQVDSTAPALRWLSWGGWRLMIGQYLLPLSAAALGLAGLARWSIAAPGSDPHGRVRSARADQGAVFIPMCFFFIGCCYYFRMVHHFRMFLWALVPAAAWQLQRRGGVLRTSVAGVWFPGFATMVRAILAPAVAASPLLSVSLPTGGTIHTSAPMAEQVRFLARFAAEEAHGAPVLLIPGRHGLASGWYYAYHVAHATRHTYFVLGLIRPYEEDSFIETLSRTIAFIECDDDEGNGLRPDAALDAVFPPAVSRAILSRLEPWKSEAGCRVHHLR